MTTATLLMEDTPAGSGVLDAVVVGAGPAGLSAAIVLGRARRRVLVIDTGRAANRVSNAVGGLLGQVGVAPAELRRSAREQLREYQNAEVRDDEAIDAEALPDGLVVT